jgi:TatA/E family protein of Tat protein translocase
MGPLGFTEILFILLLALLLFGPKRLPELGRHIGRGLAEFRRASNDLRATIEDEVHTLEREATREPASREPVTPAPSSTKPSAS